MCCGWCGLEIWPFAKTLRLMYVWWCLKCVMHGMSGAVCVWCIGGVAVSFIYMMCGLVFALVFVM